MSSSDLMLDVSQAAELKMAFRRHGWTNAQIKTLSEGHILRDVLEVINGRSEIKKIEHWIDTEAKAKEFNSLNLAGIVSHDKSKRFDFMTARISLYQSSKQKKSKDKGLLFQDNMGSVMKKIQTKLKEGYIALNVNVLDYLLNHQEIIPKEWRGKNVFFVSTKYFDHGGSGIFRFMRFNGSRWEDSIRFDDGLFKFDDFITLYAPNPFS